METVFFFLLWIYPETTYEEVFRKFSPLAASEAIFTQPIFGG